MTAKQKRGAAQLKKKRGVRVIHRGEPLSSSTVRETLEEVRRERDDRNLSPSSARFFVSYMDPARVQECGAAEWERVAVIYPACFIGGMRSARGHDGNARA